MKIVMRLSKGKIFPANDKAKRNLWKQVSRYRKQIEYLHILMVREESQYIWGNPFYYVRHKPKE